MGGRFEGNAGGKDAHANLSARTSTTAAASVAAIVSVQSDAVLLFQSGNRRVDDPMEGRVGQVGPHRFGGQSFVHPVAPFACRSPRYAASCVRARSMSSGSTCVYRASVIVAAPSCFFGVVWPIR